ncbi:undecaprenyl-phosphate 4-deoxy-4-formamido-L-arabinose transferase [Dyadobacter sp. BE34]|uniref:Undecaprenyl-phosphate 4-deoxy-4-formamido-L-arabinose transferase n=1 Tax=Dyadobacter fermentans TaxID=94254 RepID=A0ABU1R3T8_9BACT|nr:MULTISPECIES: glycosyltransferase family 2 protein [Dyadobacter]MDR6807594.1 undecaprenyl-phosphate 4-deoxy-4-formamido-L-arabinose transferase [Dyadobacter fermentans]MDR7045335.1 undecaprenyl-phosphate 4-deoxy-4-formamido-L-arabinose transferase [Dyadobacter sp. BE242]MDR7199648.1 undecaprenyl-phosphate 4-deoxy-4-formamido-L-arabinose transferase [Dyadobacter sp. BE34]MDR7217893.1 undecaprenyl-phosphate 4-deoxy-4-formamido-L-arabinose transferase [Dyadobacter sp. BE31]MDR7265539.1 undecap
MKLSVIIPVYNSEKTIRPLIEKLQATLSEISFEIVMVNDGSRDRSEQVCRELSDTYANVRFISLRRNYGEFNAVMCGLNWAYGNYCVMIDDDFQNPPEEILKLVETAESGDYDVVYTYYAKKQHSVGRNMGSKFVNWLTSYLLNKPKDLYLSSFKLIRQEVVQEIIKYHGPYPYIDGLIFRITRNIGTVQVAHQKREEGASNYTFHKLISLFLNILFCYSSLPIRFFVPIGVGLFSLGFLLLLFLTIQWIIGPDPKGWQVVTATIIFIGGIQCMLLSVLGEYIGKSFMAQSGQPQYVIKYNSSEHV